MLLIYENNCPIMDRSWWAPVVQSPYTLFSYYSLMVIVKAVLGDPQSTILVWLRRIDNIVKRKKNEEAHTTREHKKERGANHNGWSG